MGIVANFNLLLSLKDFNYFIMCDLILFIFGVFFRLFFSLYFSILCLQRTNFLFLGSSHLYKPCSSLGIPLTFLSLFDLVFEIVVLKNVVCYFLTC
jgi:hypothetical protein